VVLKLHLELLDQPQQIELKILQCLVRDIDKALNTTANKVTPLIRQLVRDALIGQPEVVSLRSGRLRGDFGLHDGGERINEIIDLWTKQIIVKKKLTSIRNRKISAGFTISMIRHDFEDVLSLNVANVVTEKGQVLPWLQWLLLFGDKVIIRDYDISFTPSPRSRSGTAVMVNRADGRWGVPPQFSGTINNNFTIRAINEIEKDIMALIEDQLKRNIK